MAAKKSKHRNAEPTSPPADIVPAARATLLEFWTPQLIAIIVIGAAVRLWYINQPMRYDESVTFLYFAGKPWMTAIGSYTYPNNHVFHSALVKLCVTLFGNSPPVIRLPAFAAGIALIPMTFSVGRRTVGVPAAYLGAAFVAASGALTLYSTNARGYSMVCLATLIMMDLLLRLRDRSSTGMWIGVVAAATLGLWTVPTMLYPAGGLALWFAVSAARGDTHDERGDVRRLAIAIVATAVATALLYAPIVSRGGLAPLTKNSFVQPSSWSEFFADLAGSIKPLFAQWTLGVPAAVGIVASALILVGLLPSRKGKRGRVPISLAMLGWCAAVLLVTQRSPFVRVWLFLFAPAALVAGRGIVRLLSERAAVPRTYGTASVVVALSLATLSVLRNGVDGSRDTGTLRDADAITHYLAPRLQRGDHIIAPVPSNAPLQYAFLRAGLDTAYFARTETMPPHAYLIVNTGEGLTIRSPLADPVMDKFSEAERIAEFPFAELFKLDVAHPRG